MSIAWTLKEPDDRPAPTNRGGAPVGHVAELPPLERAALLYFRQWRNGPNGREAVAHAFSQVFTPTRAVQEVNTLAALMAYLSVGQRRPIMGHCTGCACFGGDESAFVNLIAAAAADDKEDAMAFALTLMRPDAAWQAVMAAKDFGLALLGLNRSFVATEMALPAWPAPKTRH